MDNHHNFSFDVAVASKIADIIHNHQCCRPSFETAAVTVGAQVWSTQAEVTNLSLRTAVIVDPTVTAARAVDIHADIVGLIVGTVVDVDLKKSRCGRRKFKWKYRRQIFINIDIIINIADRGSKRHRRVYRQQFAGKKEKNAKEVEQEQEQGQACRKLKTPTMR